MRTVHLIHGFNQRHKIQQPKMAQLIPDIEAAGLNWMVHDYGHWDLIATRNNKNLARLIYPHIKEGDTLVGFSNGAALIAHLLKMGVCPARVVLIQPALSKRWTPPACVREVTVFWNDDDMATVAGKHWRRLTGLLPWRWQDRHHWGEMGHTGYVGQDPRFIQYDTLRTKDLPATAGHNDWIKKKNRAWWPFIVAHC